MRYFFYKLGFGNEDVSKYLGRAQVGEIAGIAARDTYGVQGRSRKSDEIGRASVQFKKRPIKAMMMAGRSSGWVSEALRNIGRTHITNERLQPLRARMGAKDKK